MKIHQRLEISYLCDWILLWEKNPSLPTHWNIDFFKTIIRHSTVLYSVKDKRANLCVLFYYSCDILYFYWYCFQSRYLNIIHFHPRLRATKFWNANSLLTASQFFFERGKIFLSADDFNENPTVPTKIFPMHYPIFDRGREHRSWTFLPTRTIEYRSISTWSCKCQNTSRFQSSPAIALTIAVATALAIGQPIAFAVALTIAIDIDHAFAMHHLHLRSPFVCSPAHKIPNTPTRIDFSPSYAPNYLALPRIQLLQYIIIRIL